MKKFSIVRICASEPYREYFAQYFLDHKLDSLSYENVIHEYCKYGYLVPGSWSSCMRKLGHQSIDILPDFDLLQKKWADENGLPFSTKASNWQLSFLLKQIEHLKPDVIFFYAGGWGLMPDHVRIQLKHRFPFLKVVTGLWGDTISKDESYSKFKDADIIFCAYPYIVDELGSFGIKASLLGNCFDPLTAEAAGVDQAQMPVHDFIFAGSSGFGFTNHMNRYTNLIDLMSKSDLKIWCYEPKIDRSRYRRAAVRNFACRLIQRLPNRFLRKLHDFLHEPGIFTQQVDKVVNLFLPLKHGNQLLRLYNEALQISVPERWDLSLKPISALFPLRCFSPKFGIEYFRLIRDSRVVFNRHTDEDNHAGNIRMYEVTGMGSCLLTDKPEESKRLFELDREIVAYSSIDECLEKAKFLLSNEKVRSEIARKGRQRFLKDHTVMNRCQHIHETLQELQI